MSPPLPSRRQRAPNDQTLVSRKPRFPSVLSKPQYKAGAPSSWPSPLAYSDPHALRSAPTCLRVELLCDPILLRRSRSLRVRLTGRVQLGCCCPVVTVCGSHPRFTQISLDLLNNLASSPVVLGTRLCVRTELCARSTCRCSVNPPTRTAKHTTRAAGEHTGSTRACHRMARGRSCSGRHDLRLRCVVLGNFAQSTRAIAQEYNSKRKATPLPPRAHHLCRGLLHQGDARACLPATKTRRARWQARARRGDRFNKSGLWLCTFQSCRRLPCRCEGSGPRPPHSRRWWWLSALPRAW